MRMRMQAREVGQRRQRALRLLSIPVLAGALFFAEAGEARGPAERETRAAIARIQKLNPRINAVIALEPGAIEQARALDRQTGRRGILYGLPVLVKDNIETAGPLPTTAGSLALLGNVTGRDAHIVARLRAEGAVILGKTNLSEWANFRSSFSISGWSSVGGQTRNPHALDRNPCGSSSGSAAAVAAGMVAAAVGTETDGSIVCPASVNGIVGFKPTLGFLSRTGIVPLAASQDTAGPMTASVMLAARLLDAMSGSDPDDPETEAADRRREPFAFTAGRGSLSGVRIGVLRGATIGTEGAQSLFEEALAQLAREGAVLVEIAELPGGQALGGAEFEVLLTEFRAGLNAYLERAPAAVGTRTLAEVIAFNQETADRSLALFGQDILEKAEATKGLDDPGYRAALATAQRLAGPEGLETLFAEHQVEVLVAPTTPAAWPIDTVSGDTPARFPGISSLAAVSGAPHLTVPMGQVRGLPVGLSFIGPRWTDARVLALGAAFEKARGALPPPALLPSIEASPEVAPLLSPLPR
jgi:amidase